MRKDKADRRNVSKRSNTSTRRRDVLRTVGAGVAGLTILGSAQASSQSTAVDTDFDPADDDEIRSFAKEFHALSRDKQRTVYEELSKQQQAGAKKAFAPTETEVTFVTSESDGPKTQADISPQARHWGEWRVTGKSTLGSDLWTWHHRLNWSYNGDSVWNPSSNDWADIHDSTWGYDGNSSKNMQEGNNWCKSFRQGGFSFLGSGYGFNANPYARLEGWADKTFNVLDSDKGY